MILALFAMAVMWLSFLVPWGFVLMYHLISGGRWRAEMTGWHIMAITTVDGLIFAMVIAASLFPSLGRLGWYQWLSLFVVAGVPAVTVWRAVILWRLYHPREK